jgi:hypothetical protein
MSQCVVVLGMHRSGTSCATRILHRLGVYLGENFCTEPMPSNLTGHWEARDVVAINDQILAHSGGSWDKVPDQLTWNTECDQQIKRTLAQFATRAIYGWKDPRTTITFPAWKQHLPAYTLLATIRHPFAVAQSLAVRDGLDIAAGLRLWSVYNRHLLEHISLEREVFWFPYDEPALVLTAHLRRLCAHLQLPFGDDAMDAVNPYLRHSREGDDPAAGEALALYEELLGRSRASLNTAAASNADAACNALPSEVDASSDLVRARERSLREVLSNLSAAQQMHMRRMQEIDRVAAEQIARISVLEDRLRRSIAYSTAIEERLFRVEAGSPGNVLRRWLGHIPGLRAGYHFVRGVFETNRVRFTSRLPAKHEDVEADGQRAKACA